VHVHRVGRGRVCEPLGLGEDGCDDHARLDDGHADPEGLHLLGQDFADSLDGVLHRRVVAVPGDGHAAGN
jgi:hypothetical protein